VNKKNNYQRLSTLRACGRRCFPVGRQAYRAYYRDGALFRNSGVVGCLPVPALVSVEIERLLNQLPHRVTLLERWYINRLRQRNSNPLAE